tara:strand:+ start:5667 stop:5843 length:177 start_codon:yes stop_codon:yes gene_type:complete
MPNNKQYNVNISFTQEEYNVIKERAKDRMRSIKSQVKYDVLTSIIEDEAYDKHMNGAS